MSLLPIIAIGAAIIVFGGKKKKKPAKNGKALLPANVYGDVFDGASPPDMIKATTGERFSVRFDDISSTGYIWSVSASPPDNSIELVKEESKSLTGTDTEVIPGAGSVKYFIFKGAKPGKGSLVFHLQRPWLEGKEPPSQIVEIQTEIS